MSSEKELKNLKRFLDRKAEYYESPEFVETDPVQIPHLFQKKEDIEISGFLTSTIAWGQRKNIIKSAGILMNLLDNDPCNFICEAKAHELDKLNCFVYRTFNNNDCIFFIKALKYIYLEEGGLENVFTRGYIDDKRIFSSLAGFHTTFFEVEHSPRSEKHVANVMANASAKRLNLFLRWMVRSNDKGIDFGLWKNIYPGSLMIPLDLHTGYTARKLGLLQRKQNDWKAVEELTSVLRTFDPADPVKYDFALFGMGAFE
jgi:uncharacterized protein (TIGR02757 family)